MYRCDGCDEQDKEWRGCGKVVENDVLNVECTCDGDKACSVCGGDGFTVLHQCPVSYVNNPQTNIIRKLFQLWRVGGKSVWPDGAPAIDQPSSLVSAFSAMEYVTVEGESRDMKAERDRIQNHGNAHK